MRRFREWISQNPVVRFVWRNGAIVVVALLFLASFPLSNLYNLADDHEAARRLHLFAKYVLVATGFGLAVWFCPPNRLIVRLLLALFFLSELWDGVQYAVCRLAKPEDTTDFLAQAWGTGIPNSMCARVFNGEYPREIQVGILLVAFLLIMALWIRTRAAG